MRDSLKIGQKEKQTGWDVVKDEEILSNVDDFDKPAHIKNKEKHTAALVTWWINVIRTSTLNNGKDSRLGPPVIMLKHGPLYQDAKFICQKYDISFDETAGYDTGSLLNRRINVSMDLLEVKFGSGYTPGDINKGDALTGWQDLFEHGRLDPNNDTVPKRPPNHDAEGLAVEPANPAGQYPSHYLPDGSWAPHPRTGL